MLEANGSEAFRRPPIRDGDLVCVGSESQELYSVIIVRDGRCWLRNLETGMDTLAGLTDCHRLAYEVAAYS